MSTRATVHFQTNGETKAIVYRHCDGYPDGLGEDLHRFLFDLPRETRFDEPTCLAAQFVVWHANRQPFDKDGIGPVKIVLQDPGDIEYRYLVYCDERTEKPEVEIESLRE